MARGATALTLEVRPSNHGAQELYRRFGFAPAGMRKLYYRDPDEDGLIMWAHDIDEPAYLTRLASDRDRDPRHHRRRRRGVEVTVWQT